MKDEHRTVLRAQPAEAPIEGVAIRDLRRRVRVGRCLWEMDDADRSAALAVRFPVHAPHEHPMKPRVEPVEISQALQVAPGEDEGLLDGVVREIAVTEGEVITEGDVIAVIDTV